MTRPNSQRQLQEQQPQRRQEEEAVETFSTIAAVICTTDSFDKSFHHRRLHQNQGKFFVQHWGSRSLLLVFGILWIAQQPLCCVASFTTGEYSPHHGHQQFHSNHHRRFSNENIRGMRSSKATKAVQRRIIQQLTYCSLQQGIVAAPALLSHHRGSSSVSASHGQNQPQRNHPVVVCHGKKWNSPTPLSCSSSSLSKHPPQPSRSFYSSTRLFASMTPSSSSPPMAPTGSSSGSDNDYSPYDQWVRRLYMTNFFHPVKMGLKNMQQLHELLGYPMDNPNVAVIHVAGTNGKGSVALKIATTLQQYGLRVGLFCSPHVSSFRERMQVDGELITEDEVVELLPHIYDLCEQHDIPATFFEITTALAFAYYARHQTQVVVLETGLGGRLDATNVITKPAISIITSIGLEHTRILGDTIELIALEKGGIIKPNCPVLVGPHCPQDVLRQCARDKNSGPYYTPSDVLKGDSASETDDYDKENQQMAKAALILLQSSHPHLIDASQKPLTEEALERGTSVRPPCRFEQVQEDGLTVILDVAHNPPAMEYLVRKLKATYPDATFRVVLGMSSDKDLGQCGRSILEIAKPDSIHLVEAAHPRAAKLEAMREADARLLACHCDLEDRSITKQIVLAKILAKEAGEILVVCGSVFLMAEAREALGFDEPRDSEYVAAVAGAGFRHGQEQFGNTPKQDDTKK